MDAFSEIQVVRGWALKAQFTLMEEEVVSRIESLGKWKCRYSTEVVVVEDFPASAVLPLCLRSGNPSLEGKTRVVREWGQGGADRGGEREREKLPGDKISPYFLSNPPPDIRMVCFPHRGLFFVPIHSWQLFVYARCEAP